MVREMKRGLFFLLGGLALACAAPASAEADGAHDFDFNLGRWHTEITRLVHPFSGSDETIALQGTVTVRPVWNGRAELEEIEADGPNGHWEGMTLFLYNPKARQWSQSYYNAADPTPNAPLIGEFRDGRGDLYTQEIYAGRAILVRGSWFEITPYAHRFEESFSQDGGRSWVTVFKARLTRIKA